MQKITQLVDIEAPCEDVFNTIIDIHKRMQLSPLWGISHLQEVSPDYPEPGSHYHIKILKGAPFDISQGALNPTQSALAGLAQVLLLKLGETQPLDGSKETIEQVKKVKKAKNTGVPTEQEYYIAECHSPCVFSYQLTNDCETCVTWRLMEIPLGTRINYEETFCDTNIIGENFVPTVQRIVREWLTNIKQYSELRGSRGRLLIKWFLDRFYLKLLPDQRRVILMLLFMQAIGLASFTIAVFGWAVTRLFV